MNYAVKITLKSKYLVGVEAETEEDILEKVEALVKIPEALAKFSCGKVKAKLEVGEIPDDLHDSIESEEVAVDLPVTH